jgi:DNA transposition AAA+ family ATPase
MDSDDQKFLSTPIDLTIQSLRAYMEEKRASQLAVARGCGLSPTVISQFLRGEYKGDLNAVIRAIQNFLIMEEEREAAFLSPRFADTEQSLEALSVCALAHKYRFLGLILGRAGLGKTMALREYSRRHSNAVLITSSTWSSSRGAIAKLLSRALRVSTGYYSLSDAVELIVHRLGSGSIILIDESQCLDVQTLEGIRFIGDSGKVGIVLSGTLSFASRMSDKRVGMNYEQLASRIGCRRTLPEKVEREDVKKIVSQAIPNAPADIVDFCHEKCNGAGAFRTMTRYLQLATGAATTIGEPISLRHFRGAEKILMV